MRMANRLTPVWIDSEGVQLFPATKREAAVTHMVKAIHNHSFVGSTLELESVGHQLASKIKARSLVILVGDFLGVIDLSVLSRRHEIFVIIVRDRFEESPYELGDVSISDPESRESVELYFGKHAKEGYHKRYQENDAKLFAHLKSLGIRYVKICTDEDAWMKLRHV